MSTGAASTPDLELVLHAPTLCAVRAARASFANVSFPCQERVLTSAAPHRDAAPSSSSSSSDISCNTLSLPGVEGGIGTAAEALVLPSRRARLERPPRTGVQLRVLLDALTALPPSPAMVPRIVLLLVAGRCAAAMLALGLLRSKSNSCVVDTTSRSSALRDSQLAEERPALCAVPAPLDAGRAVWLRDAMRAADNGLGNSTPSSSERLSDKPEMVAAPMPLQASRASGYRIQA